MAGKKHPKKRRFSKKGQVQNMFNWIFILVAGFVILILAVYFIRQQITSSTQELHMKIGSDIEAVFKDSFTNRNTWKEVKTPEVPIKFVCEGNISTMTVGDSPVSIDMKNYITFSEEKLTGTKLITLTRDWRLPFRTTPLIYITNGNTMYHFINQNTQTSKVKELLPNGSLIKTHDSINDLNKLENYENHRFILFDKEPSGYLNNVRGNKVSAINIVPSGNEVMKRGEVTYYSYSRGEFSERNTSYYYGEDLLRATVLSGSAETYECNMQKALSKLKLMLEISITRVERLEENSPRNCVSIYIVIQDSLNKMLESVGMSESFFETVEAEIPELKENNQDLQRSKGCPLIY